MLLVKRRFWSITDIRNGILSVPYLVNMNGVCTLLNVEEGRVDGQTSEERRGGKKGEQHDFAIFKVV